MSREVASQARQWDAANLQAALLILSDPERHGGEDALSVIWARRVVRGSQMMLEDAA